jgi:hypothetical protein
MDTVLYLKRLFTAFVICLPLAWGQIYYSTVVGTVRDSSGAIIANANVTVTEISTGVEASASTNEAGDYRFETLRPGLYSMAVSAPGFKREVVDKVELFVAQASRVDVELEVGNTSEKVTVSGAGSLIQTESAERGGILGTREIEALPLQSRNVTELTFLVPGVVSTPSASSGSAIPAGNVNGNLEFANQYNVDGGTFMNPLTSQPIEFINIDTIEEFRVETSNYSAEVGMHAGGIINIATKHGTDDLHGSLYEFFQNDKLNARNFFAVGKPPVRYNLFGGTVGGRIIRDKLFFFGSYEGVRNQSPQTFLSQVPTAAELQGNFTPGTGAKDAIPYDPYSTDASGNRTPFPNDTIPKSLWNPVSVNYLSYWPAANRAGSPNFIYNGATVDNYDRYSVRMDYNISARDTLYGRYGYQNNPGLSPGALPGDGNGSNTNIFHGSDAVLAWNHNFGAASLNEARFSFVNGTQNQYQSDFQGQNIVQQLGLPYSSSLSSYDSGCPPVSFSNVSTTGTCSYNYNIHYPEQTYYFTDDYSFHSGKHNFKIGFLTMRFLSNSVNGRPGGGGFTFSGIYTTQIGSPTAGQPFADFLLGAQSSLGYTAAALKDDLRQNAYQVYFQDDWKVSSKLTLQLGLRYDIDLPPYAADGQLTGWVDGLGSRTGQELVFPANAKNAVTRLLAANNGNLGFPYEFSDNNWISPPHWLDLGPRLGFAYRPLGGSSLVIRGGFGIFYDVLNASNLQHNIGSSLPFVATSATPALTQTYIPPPYLLGQMPPAPTTWYTPGQLLGSNYATDPSSGVQSRVNQWNLTIQKGFGNNWAIEAAYVGNYSTNGANVYNWNRVYPVGYTFNYSDGTSFTITNDTPLLQRSKYPDIANGYVSVPNGRVHYEGGQFQISKRLSHGLEFRVGYTRSKTLGLEGQQTNNSTVVQDEWNQNNLNVPLQSDIPNNFFATFAWQLPGATLKGALGAIGGGWQVAGIVHIQTGDVDRLQLFGNWPGAWLIDPLLTCDPNLPSSQRTVQRWFNTSCVVAPGPNQFGDNTAIGILRGDGMRNLDATMSKYFSITERQKLQFRAEFFNAFNHPLFGDPANTQGTSTFGEVTSAGPGRAIQLALKYQF